MADRGRDLKIAILSDVDKFDADQPAKQLDRLADAADAAGKRLDNLDDHSRHSKDRIDDVGDQAKRTASKVDDAFDAIARSSRANLRQKVDDDTDHVKRSFEEVQDEARSTGREMAASFTGSSEDIMGALQELGANAGAAFGPAGDALALALGAGLGIFFADWQKRKEKLQEDVDNFTQALIEGNGKLSEEFLNQQIAAIDTDKIKELQQAARDANVDVATVIRAYAGDPAAIDAVNRKLDEAAQALKGTDAAAAAADPTMQTYYKGVQKVRGELGLTKQALGQSKTAFEVMRDAMQQPVTANITVGVDIPSPRELDAINRRIRAGLGTIVIPVQPGQNRFENNANNSRYRY